MAFNPASSSRLPKPTSPSSGTTTPTYRSQKSLYSYKHSGSKAHLPHPKVLPFPDLPVRPISRDGSRPTSPISPGFARPSVMLQGRSESVQEISTRTSLAALSMQRAGGGSSDGMSSSFERLSPPSLDMSASTPHLAGPSRSRETTGGGVMPPAAPIPRAMVSRSNLVPASSRSTSDIPMSSPVLSTSLDPPSSTTALQRTTSSQFDGRPDSPNKPRKSSSLQWPDAIPLVPAASEQPLSGHLYRSFLQGTCADVRVSVRRWRVGYMLHKVVLVQAGFFHSLFTGGFSEMLGLPMTASVNKGKGKAADDDDWNGEHVELTFDDPNITRAAFETCLSRLYSPFPHLHFPVALLSTPSNPLTTPFPPFEPLDLANVHASTLVNIQLATPRLLLSLLATTTYLGLSELLRESLALILRTVGPHTVVRYLNFAIGDGFGREEWDGQDTASARGLEELGRSVASHKDSNSSLLSDTSIVETGEKKSQGNKHSRQSTSSIISADDAMPHFYGWASNKIGEACVCWLARWGIELLHMETASGHNKDMQPIWGRGGLPARFVQALLSSDTLFVLDEMERYRATREVLNLRRKGREREMEGIGDLGLGPTDDGGDEEWDEDEEELEKIFAEGIYYMHMNFDDLSVIAADIDALTSLPYAPLPVLQAAHWAAADVRARVTSHEKGDVRPLSSTPVEENELGLALTTSEISVNLARRSRRTTARSRLSSPSLAGDHSYSTASVRSRTSLGAAEEMTYHPVIPDDTYRMGAGGLLLGVHATSSLPGTYGLPDLGPSDDLLPSDGAMKKSRPPPQGETTYFGLLNGCRPASDLSSLPSALSLSLTSRLLSSDQKEDRWTTHQPFRFSVSFYGVDKLAEKERAYSQTVFYAGSWFNVYVQTIRKKEKGIQLGIYLHRQTTVEPFPPASAPGDRAEMALKEGSPGLVNRGNPDLVVRSGTATAVHGQSGKGGKREEEYRDTRHITKAYFSITCFSALGTALIRFSSAPDSFTLSQSWGWKSSALRSEEYLTGTGVGEEAGLGEGVLGWVGEGEVDKEKGMGEYGSLRASVVVGVI